MPRAFIDYSGNTGGGGSGAGRAGVGIPSVPHVSSLADDIEDEVRDPLSSIYLPRTSPLGPRASPIPAQYLLLKVWIAEIG